MISSLSWRDYGILTVRYLSILVGLFLLINIVHFKIFHPHIVFHAMMLDIFITVFLCFFFFKIMRFIPFHAIFFVNASIIFILTAVLYGALGPTMADRSLTVFLLQKVEAANQTQESITVNDLVYLADKEYVKKSYMVEKRLIEQQASGSMKIEGDEVFLTPFGKLSAKAFDFFDWMLDIKRIGSIGAA